MALFVLLLLVGFDIWVFYRLKKWVDKKRVLETKLDRQRVFEIAQDSIARGSWKVGAIQEKVRDGFDDALFDEVLFNDWEDQQIRVRIYNNAKPGKNLVNIFASRYKSGLAGMPRHPFALARRMDSFVSRMSQAH